MLSGSTRAMSLEFPSGAVPLDSPFYIERPPIEELVYREILKPGSVIRIQAPKRMGKSSLLVRIIERAKAQGYQTVTIDFQQADRAVYANLNQFLRWFCINIARQLQLKPLLEEYWDESMGIKVSCTIYFQYYLLKTIQTPLVLALNEVNRVFEHASIAQDFLPLLRFWHEQSKQIEIFQKLRLVVVHSTEIYVPLNINQSPFNVGLPIKLSEFNLNQVQDLALRYGLDWREENRAQQLMEMVGGHPYLVGIALYHLAQDKMRLEQLLAEAPTQSGIYSELLLTQWEILRKRPALGKALKQVVTATYSVKLEPLVAYKLNSMGLVKLDGDRCIPSCQLYRLYFAQQQLERKDESSDRLEALEKENQHLKSLIHLDSLTQIANRRCFDEHLATEWNRMARQQTPLSLILLDIDYFKLYNDTYGHPKGDTCLQQVANAMRECLKRSSDLAARYGGEEFAAILPATDLMGAVCIARQIRESIKALAIEHINSKVGLGIVTASIGVASIIPHPESEPTILLDIADNALYLGKKQGRDRVSVASANSNAL